MPRNPPLFPVGNASLDVLNFTSERAAVISLLRPSECFGTVVVESFSIVSLGCLERCDLSV
jgi:hypothetical protein